MASVRIERVSKAFRVKGNVVPAILDFSLEIADGEFVVLVGPSGCGKSTTLRVVAGLERPDEGHIFLGDIDVTALPPQQRAVGMVFQDYALYPHLSIFENLAYALRARNLASNEVRQRVEPVARLLRIEALLERRPAMLSGGQQQRVAVGRALLREPKLFLFDEPLSNVDAQLRTELRSELIALQRRLGSTMLYVTHDQTEALTMADRVVVMSGGRIFQTGSPRDVLERPADTFVARFIGTPPMNLIRGELRGGVFSAPGLSLKVGAVPGATGECVLGLRPAAFKIAPEGPLRGSLALVERGGAETYARIETECAPLTVRGGAEIEELPIGAPVAVEIDARGATFFDVRSGARIEGNRLHV